MRRIIVLVVAGMFVAVLGAGAAAAQGAGATAQLQDSEGNRVGTAEFTEVPEGVAVTVNLQSGQNVAGPGEHGLHIHETGSISPDFEAAGDHFNPTNAEHGLQNPSGPHAGDLENITVNEDGSASYQGVNERVTLTGGQNALLDSDGSTLIIHAGSDDQQTDPSGESGGRVIAGVIQEPATGESTMETTGGRSTLPTSGGLDVVNILAFSGVVCLVAAVLLWRRASRSS